MAATYNNGEPSSFQLIGEGIFLRANSTGFSLPVTFRAGETVIVRGSVGTVTLGNNFYPLDQTVNGTFYPQSWLFGGLDFVGEPFVAPPAPTGAFRNFSTPFVVNGHLEGYADSNRTAPLFAVTVTGSGVAYAGYRVVNEDVWDRLFDGGTTFRFSPASASPTPEPATMVLLASGLVIAGARRFRARIRR